MVEAERKITVVQINFAISSPSQSLTLLLILDHSIALTVLQVQSSIWFG